MECPRWLCQPTRMEEMMSVNGITESTSTAYTSYTSSAKETKNAEKSAENTATGTTVADSGVVYEKSNTEKTANAASTGKTQYANPDLVAKLKADAEARTSQLQNIVTQMLSKQGVTFAKANDMWSILASGNFTVDPATKAQAQADIADDGYWGVNQTSDRIIDFAKALAGDDPDQLEKMRSAFEKGYKQAEKTWGGKLPDISQKTYDAVMKKFDELTQKKDSTADTTAAADSTTTTV